MRDWNNKEARNEWQREWRIKTNYNARQRQYRAANAQRIKAVDKIRRDKIKEKLNADQRLRRTLEAQLRYKYGITIEQYQEIIQRQDNRCAICRVQFSETFRPYVDHDHEDRNVRGLLCTCCNSGLGMFIDSIDILDRAVEYLKNPPISGVVVNHKFHDCVSRYRPKGIKELRKSLIKA